MASWSYECYPTDGEVNLWQKWYDDHEDCRGQHDEAFDWLESMAQWSGPRYKKLKDCGGLGEVRFKAKNVQWRVFGFFKSGNVFVIVGIGNHRESYKPRDILKTCMRRMSEINKGDKVAEAVIRPEID